VFTRFADPVIIWNSLAHQAQRPGSADGIAIKIAIVVLVAMNRSAIRIRAAQPGTRSRCLTRTIIQENGGLHSSRRTENRDLTQAQASRHLSPTIGTKQNILTVNLTVKLKWCREKPSVFM
jgi:hypothetical protein